MQGSIAQTLALAITGNAFLQGRDIGRFWPDASAFNFCGQVTFVVRRRGLFRASYEPMALDPLAWFAQLQSDCRGLRLHLVSRDDPNLSDRLGVGFVGGGSRWLIEAVGDKASSLWEADWQVGDENAPERRIWRVSYIRLKDDHRSGSQRLRDLAAVREDLRAALEDIAAFSERNALGWEAMFRSGLTALGGGEPERAGFYLDMAPPGFLAPEARHTIAACSCAWVFGGMGSWNDGAYGGELTDEGDRLSDRLFRLLQEGLVTAANTSFAG